MCVAALIDLWLLHCYKTPPTLVGAHCVRPCLLQKLVWFWSGRTEFAPTSLRRQPIVCTNRVPLIHPENAEGFFRPPCLACGRGSPKRAARALGVRVGSVTLGEKQHTVLFFKTLAPLRYPLEKAFGVCSHKLVGVGAYDDPRLWRSYFSFERGTTPVSGTNEQAREFNAILFCGRGLL